MRIGMIGLPNSGKTTVFNALTRSEKPVESFSSGQVHVHTAVVDVPDPRVDTLSAMFAPERTTYATITFNDISGFGKGRGSADIGGALLNAVANNDALMLVVRAFTDENLPHPAGTVDAFRDLSLLESELILSDMTVIDRRIERLAVSRQRGTPDEKKRMATEADLLARLMQELERETALRDVELSESERRLVSGYGLLSLKPLLRIVNGDEHAAAEYQVPGSARPVGRAETSGVPGEDVLFLRGKLEAEIAQMEAEEMDAFLAEFGIPEPGLHRAIRLSYRMLGRETFFTVGEDEVRAWSMRAGTKAVDAAGIIHSDLQRGFIRAETVSYTDLMSCGSLREAKTQGKLRLEGKEYVVKDGDVLAIRYNL